MDLINKLNWLRYNYKIEKDLLYWIIIGVLIRVILMPLGSVDLGAQAIWSNEIYLGYYNIYQRLFDVFGQQNISGNQYPPFIYYYLGGWISLLNFFHLLDTSSWEAMGNLIFENKATFPEINRTLFLLKSSYLIFDLSIAYLLVQMVERGRKKLILVLYFLNPITLFVVYVQGQFDILPSFFVILSLYFAKKSYEQHTAELNRYSFLSVIALGVGAGFKTYTYLLLPIFVVFLYKNTLTNAIKLFIMGLWPFILSILPFLIISPHSFLNSQAMNANSRIFGFFFDVGNGHNIYVFFLLYFVLLIYLRFRETIPSFELLWKNSFVVLTLFYISSYWHPQWYLLIIPFTMLTVSTSPRLMGLYFMQIIMYAIYILDWGTHIEIIFSPTVPFLSKLPGLKSGISLIYPFEQVYGFFFTLFVALSLGMMVLSFKKLLSSDKENDIKKVGIKMSLVLIVFFLILFSGLIGYIYSKDISPSKAEPDNEIEVNENTIAGQSFVSHYSNLRMIVVRTSGEVSVDNVVFSLRSDPLSTKDLVNITGKASKGWGGDIYYSFDFSPIPDSKNKSYYFEIKTKDFTSNLKLGRVSVNSYYEGEAYVNNKPIEGNLMFTTYFKAKFSEIMEEEKIHIKNLVGQDKRFFAFYLALIVVLLYCLRWTRITKS